MLDPLQTIKPGVRGLKAYSLSLDRARVKVNQNENPWDMPERVKQESLRRLAKREWSRYPDFIPASLHERLAQFVGWRADGVIAGNGSNELIQALLMVTVMEGKRVLINEPTFALYRQITTVLGGEVLSLPLKTDLTYDADAILKTIESSQPDVTIICSPNNPTGCVIEREALVRILERARGLVAIDEAYFEFADQTVTPLLNEHKNLVVLHTFSKAMAAAALRVGYLLAAPELSREISKAVLPYNLNAISQTIAETAIELYDEEMKPLVEKIIRERDQLFAAIQSINGLAPVPTRANFMVVRSMIDPRKVFSELLRRDILIRDVSGYPMLKEYFRLSVGTPEENELVIAALREIFV
ncbi:MAG TPA: histidinol-phosphate transaminase [Pyrinomonadaceae bacterium]|nr:histidinol-phosphate transaminase [Pyrinomonadaceae bacterium]